MQTTDFSSMIVLYNLVIGVLIMLSSPQIASFAGHISKVHGRKFARYTLVSTFTFGAVAATISGLIYVAFHLLRIGV